MNSTVTTAIKKQSTSPRRLAAWFEWIRSHLIDAVLLLAAGLAGLGMGLWAREIIMDDAMITFRVAENLAYGRGFVYNLGERVQVTTTPLYAMILAGGVWLAGSAPRAALVLNVALSALMPVLAYDLGRRQGGRITGLGGAILLTIAPLLVMAFSMESYLYVTLILASMDAYAARRLWLAGGLAGLTALVRGDAVLLGACLLTYDFLMTHFRLRWRLIAPAVAIPAAWYLFATLYYGRPFPATLNAKVAQGEFNWLGQGFLEGLALYWNQWIRVEDHDIFYLIPILATVGIGWAVWRERMWLVLVSRDILYVLVFVVLAVPTAEWYYAPLIPGIALLTARGIQVIAEGVAALTTRLTPRNVAAGSVAAILLAVLLSALYPTTRAIITRHPDWKAKVYPDTARWIAANTNSSANLATIDIGHLGYWSNRRIIDIVGLAQPDVSPHIAQGDFGYAIRHYQPDMVLLGYSWLPEVQRTAWFQSDYVPRRYFRYGAIEEPLLLFSRSEGVKVQPDLLPATEVHPLNVDFNRQVSLTGYQVNEPMTPGSNLILLLLWQAQSPIELDFTVFVQLVDADDNILAQGDGKPQHGFYTTNHWQPGETVVDAHIFPIPSTIPPGAYDILLGFYDAATGLRLQILDEAGTFERDFVRLSGLEVRPE